MSVRCVSSAGSKAVNQKCITDFKTTSGYFVGCTFFSRCPAWYVMWQRLGCNGIWLIMNSQPLGCSFWVASLVFYPARCPIVYFLTLHSSQILWSWILFREGVAARDGQAGLCFPLLQYHMCFCFFVSKMEKMAEISQAGERLELLKANGILIDTEVEEDEEETNLENREGTKRTRYCSLHWNSCLMVV